jgi:hypothetical protein
VRDLLQELDSFDRGLTLEADLRMMPNSLAVLQRDISTIREVLDSDLEKILSELEKMPEKMNRPSKKHQ